MSTLHETPPTSPTRTRRSSARLPVLILGVLVSFTLCYLSLSALRGISPAQRAQLDQERATATVQSALQVDAGATVVYELQAEATRTALASSPTVRPTFTTVGP